jgi:hypothetical protein
VAQAYEQQSPAVAWGVYLVVDIVFKFAMAMRLHQNCADFQSRT